MKTDNRSIFNLIEIFRQGKGKIANTINLEKHCEEKGIHDFYCDVEKPFVQK